MIVCVTREILSYYDLLRIKQKEMLCHKYSLHFFRVPYIRVRFVCSCPFFLLLLLLLLLLMLMMMLLLLIHVKCAEM